MADGQKETGKDPLSFFAVADDSSSSDSDSDRESEQKLDNHRGKRGSPKQLPSPKSKLPSPDTLFATVGRPSFLSTKEDASVDWNSLSKRYEPLFANQATYSAPPVSLTERESNEEYSDAFITSQPIKYGKELTEIQQHILVHGKRSADDIRVMAHRESSEKSEGESTSKKKRS